MQRILAIAFLTLRAAVRYRLVLLLGCLLLAGVVALPMLIKDDGTARGLTQILLTYNLALITTSLGLSTLWLACGTLASEIEECQMQMVAVKPVARWQIWLGKWLGIMILNFLLLALSGGAVFGLMKWRSGHLTDTQRRILENEVLVARAGVKEKSNDIEPLVQQIYQEKLKAAPLTESDRKLLRAQIREQVKASDQIVMPRYMRRWKIDMGDLKDSLKDQKLFIRTKFLVANDPELEANPRTYATVWRVGVPESGKVRQRELKLAANTFHEFDVPANMWDDKGVLTIECDNMTGADGVSAETNLLFLLDNGLEVLYREAGFGVNYFRGICIIFCWLALLASIGLAASSFLSFPVAAFVSLGLLIVGMSTGTLKQVVEEGGISGVNHDTGRIDNPKLIDRISVPLFTAAAKMLNLVQGFSPIDNLSTGRSITWGQLGRAVGQIVFMMGGLIALFGMAMFSRRELATSQGST
jgi:ABC-type transport system involved in multi-copper enzyme maturation permease subunit